MTIYNKDPGESLEHMTQSLEQLVPDKGSVNKQSTTSIVSWATKFSHCSNRSIVGQRFDFDQKGVKNNQCLVYR